MGCVRFQVRRAKESASRTHRPGLPICARIRAIVWNMFEDASFDRGIHRVGLRGNLGERSRSLQLTGHIGIIGDEAIEVKLRRVLSACYPRRWPRALSDCEPSDWVRRIDSRFPTTLLICGTLGRLLPSRIHQQFS